MTYEALSPENLRDLELFTGIKPRFDEGEDLGVVIAEFEDAIRGKLGLHRSIVGLIQAGNEAAQNIRLYGIFPDGNLIYTAETGDISLGDVYNATFIVENYEPSGPENDFTTSLSVKFSSTSGHYLGSHVHRFSPQFLLLLDEKLRDMSDRIIIEEVRKALGYSPPERTRQEKQPTSISQKSRWSLRNLLPGNGKKE